MTDDERFPGPFDRAEAVQAFSALADAKAPPPFNVAATAHRIRVALLDDRKRQAVLTAALARALK